MWTETSTSSASEQDPDIQGFIDQVDMDMLNGHSICGPMYQQSMLYEASSETAADSFEPESTRVGQEGDQLEFESDYPFPSSLSSLNELVNDGDSLAGANRTAAILDATCHPPSEPDITNHICSCFAQAIGVYEGIGARSIGCSRDPSTSTDQILQHQKLALMRCEDLLKCQRCCSRSDFIMLIISMCDRMLSSLHSVLERARQGRQHGQSQGSCVQRETQNNAMSSTFNVNNSSRGRPRLQIGAWQLDDEDELQVLQSLLKLRFAKLGDFVNEIGKVVDINHWPAHQHIVLNLRECSLEGTASSI